MAGADADEAPRILIALLAGTTAIISDYQGFFPQVPFNDKTNQFSLKLFIF